VVWYLGFLLDAAAKEAIEAGAGGRRKITESLGACTPGERHSPGR
jgi:hypothetical protein